jgi:hypothetical protein
MSTYDNAIASAQQIHHDLRTNQIKLSRRQTREGNVVIARSTKTTAIADTMQMLLTIRQTLNDAINTLGST